MTNITNEICLNNGPVTVDIDSLKNAVQSFPVQREVLPEDYKGPVLLTGRISEADKTSEMLMSQGITPIAFFDMWAQDSQKTNLDVIEIINDDQKKIPLVFCGQPTKGWFAKPYPSGVRIFWASKFDHIPTRSVPNLLDTAGRELIQLYNRLDDEASKQILISIIKARVAGDNGYFLISDYAQYHHPQARPKKGDFVIDAGAFDGDSAEDFSGLVQSSGSVYSVEASIENFNKLCVKCHKKNLDNVVPVYSAVWNKRGVILFKSDGGSGLITEDGQEEVPTESIDSLVSRMHIPRINSIKYDIEGAEVEGLTGAADTINKYKPNLLVSIYHKASDLWTLPQLIDDICPGYKFYMGHHNFYHTETDLYAIWSDTENSPVGKVQEVNPTLKPVESSKNHRPEQMVRLPQYMMEANYIPDPRLFIHDWTKARNIDPTVVVELGASNGQNLRKVFPNAKYLNIDIMDDESIPTLVRDICDDIFDEALPPHSADLVYSNNCLEHVEDPPAAASNIVNLLKPGGICFIRAPFSYRFHPVPNDFWRFSPEGLKILFQKLECLETGLDSAIRRKNFTGSFKNGYDKVPQDELGGWRESWMSYFIGKKPPEG